MLDIMVLSASRPKLIPYLIESVKEKVHYSYDFNVIWHEDFVYADKSKEVVEYLHNTTFWNTIIEDNPPVMIGPAISNILHNHSTSKYILNLQDDWEFELHIDLDHLIYIMDSYPHINCIYFNKRRNLPIIDDFVYKQMDFNGQLLCKSNHFPFLPGLWRADYVKQNWRINPQGKTQEGWFNKGLKEDMGSYVYGGIDHPRVVRHLGYSWAIKPWGTHPKRKDGYGGNVRLDFVGTQDRAEWLPPEPKRPQFLDNKQQEYNKAKEEFNAKLKDK